MIYEQLLKLSKKYTSKTALVEEDFSITFLEIINLIELYTQKLQNLEIPQKNQRVFITANNSIDFLLLIFALLQQKNEVILIDPKTHKNELDDIFNEFDANYFIYETILFENDFTNFDKIEL